MPRIIESVLVYDDGPDKSTELDQRMPVAAVAGSRDTSIANTAPTRPSADDSFTSDPQAMPRPPTA
jgi:hypothetical protein